MFVLILAATYTGPESSVVGLWWIGGLGAAVTVGAWLTWPRRITVGRDGVEVLRGWRRTRVNFGSIEAIWAPRATGQLHVIVGRRRVPLVAPVGYERLLGALQDVMPGIDIERGWWPPRRRGSG